MSISVAPVMEFIRESDEIQIDFHTKMYIVKECFDILGRIIESAPSKVGHFQSSQSILKAEYLFHISKNKLSDLNVKLGEKISLTTLPFSSILKKFGGSDSKKFT